MILIVDDDKAIRQSLALVLKRKGYETALAGNPDEALGMLRKHKFRLVIMDMNYSLSTNNVLSGSCSSILSCPGNTHFINPFDSSSVSSISNKF